jgi:hypothetical protein
MCISMKLLRKGQVLLFEELKEPKVSLGRVRVVEERERGQANIDC